MQSTVRVVGSGFTYLEWRGKPIAMLDSFTDSGVTAIGGQGQGWEAITPLRKKRPVEIATSRVLGPGTITANIRELWNEPVWYQLEGLRGKNNIRQVWKALRDLGGVTCQMVIDPPGSGDSNRRRKIYHNCVVTSIDDGENVQIGTLSVSRALTIVYTHATYSHGDGEGEGDDVEDD